MNNFIEEKMRELDKKFAYLGDAQGDGGSYILVTEIHKEKLKYFFRQSIEEAIAEERKRIEGAVKKSVAIYHVNLDRASEHPLVEKNEVISIINKK